MALLMLTSVSSHALDPGKVAKAAGAPKPAIPASIKQEDSPIGKVVGIRGAPTVTGPKGTRTLKMNSKVFKGDRIKTGYTEEVQLLFVDDTRLAVSTRSKITLDEYVFSDDNKAEEFVLKVAKGSFRFLSGKSRKDAYKINTRAATIGIRGTAFDFATRSGTTVIHYSGVVHICASAGNCLDISHKFEVAQTRGSRPIHRGSASQLPLNLLRFSFPYALNESRLPGGFRVGSRDCCNKQRNGGIIKTDEGDRPGNSGNSSHSSSYGGGTTPY